MTSKIMLTQEQYKALKKFTMSYLENPIDGLGLEKLGQALNVGYEVEEVYKVRDWVVNTVNHVGEIEDIHNGKYYGRWLDDGRWFEMECFRNNFKRHATAEEILWAKIGREVGEFRKNDTWIKTSGDAVVVFNTDFAKSQYEEEKLKGFYPAESFISFEDGEEK